MPANPFAKPKINEPKRKYNGNVAEKWCPDVLSQEAVSLYQTLNSIPTLARNEPNAIEGRSGKTSFVPPLDWSLSSKIIFRCDRNTRWCSETNSSEQFYISDVDFQKLPKNFRGDERKFQFHQARLQYQYPESTRSRNYMNDISILSQQTRQTRSSAESSRLAEFESRRNQWQRAFQSLYFGVRKGRHPYFYCIVENRKQFTILFYHDEQPKAILMNASRALRTTLVRKDCTFTTPLWLKEVKKEDEEFEEEDEDGEDELEEEQIGPSWKGVNLDRVTGREGGKKSSILLFEGRKECHRLYDFVSNLYAQLNTLKGDVPVLLSPKPFHHATLKPVRIRRNETYITPTRTTTHVVEFTGWVLPSIRTKLCQVMKRECNFVCKITPYQPACGINVLKSEKMLGIILTGKQSSNCVCLEKDMDRKNPYAITDISYAMKDGTFVSEISEIRKVGEY